ncbi:cell surface protein [Gelidibacter salicanalis]|uniref:Cell surface protein n=1 Tax=Gelidibacter salicanalis TaxID=291193 RepID=A0A5C7AG95_9FLAO|nr:cell surface protein [Gelidibacter salicanalis]TXE07786.1 cell surface protein [Gelidibacter salicanalis]
MKTNYNQLLLAFFSIAFLLTSCSNDDDNGVLAPEVAMAVQEQALQYYVGDISTFSAINENNSVYTETWSLGDSIVSNADTYIFVPKNSGTYKLNYAAVNEAGTFTYDYTITVLPKLRPITDDSKAFVTELIEYMPSPGQFINKKPGNLESAEGVLGGRGLVSLGGWGGSVTYAFDHTVLNHADKNDLIIYGNAMPTFSEPGIIYVMQDDNANGLPDDMWYEIKGSAHDLEGTDRAYEITYFRPVTAEGDVDWKDSKGNTGVIAKNAFHKQAYYPEWITEDSYTISGTLLSDSNVDMSNPSYITSKPFEYGYADNTSGGDQIDLADAIDAEGNPVNLSGIDFIKIQTGVQANMGWLGELSTEITGIADLNLID